MNHVRGNLGEVVGRGRLFVGGAGVSQMFGTLRAILRDRDGGYASRPISRARA